MRGQSVEQLAQLPDDVDAPSALLRIALQAGVKTYPLEKRLLDEHAWLKDPTADELSARERSWVAGHAQLAPFTAPGLAVAERMGTRLAKDAIGSSLPRFLAIGSAVAALGALAFAAAGWVLPGFGFATLAMLLFAMEAVVRRIASAGQVRPPVPLLAQAMAILLDPLLLMLIALASPEDTGWLRLFVPAVLLGLLHLGERLSAVRWRRSYADRLTLLAVLMPAVFFGVTQPVVAVLALAVLITLFLTSDARD